jgi:hypothetical protein
MKRILATIGFLVTCGCCLFLCFNSPPTAPLTDTGFTAADAPASEPQIEPLPDRIDFHTQVELILAAFCRDCHGIERQEGGVQLIGNPADWKQDVQNSLVHADIDGVSELVRRITSTDSKAQMPPEQRLSDAEIQILSQWVDEGAYWPDPQPETAADWPETDRRHWAFLPLHSAEPPTVPQTDWVRNPIDAFILDQLQRQELKPSAVASNRDLIRRLTFLVTGLPPTIDQLDRFQKSDVIGLDELTDELLGSAAYGEHWARFWLDRVRYADTNGYEDDGLKPYVWKYRDFVIRSLNDDRAYDDFVYIQIAGDLQDAPTDEDFTATGFLRLGAWDSEPDDRLAARFDQADDIVSTTCQVFMGLTAGCARCHDHPEEPITALDYARLVAVFHGLSRPTKGRLEQSAPSATPRQLAEAQATRTQLRRLQRQAMLATDETQAQTLRQQAAELETQVRFDQAYRFVDTDISRQPTRLFLRGNPHNPGEYVFAGLPSILTDQQMPATEHPRRQFARWLITENRALTARVIVNSVWQQYFGCGLADSPGNLGVSGAAPSHPELLDWLAHWFVVEADWSLKRLHRLILTSNTFRTRAEAGSETSDRRRSLFESFPRTRLRAEMMYDAILSVSGTLSDRKYGPADYPQLSDDVLATLKEKGEWARPATEHRRAIYLVVQRNVPVPFLEAFGFPTGSQACLQRTSVSTTRQALTLWNGSLTQDCAEAFADRVIRHTPSDLNAQINYAWQLALGRLPDPYERQNITRFLNRSESQTADAADRRSALRQLCLVLFNLDEFVFIN